MTEHIQVTDHDGIRTIRMNRPDKRNALTQAMYSALADAMESATAPDCDVGVIVIAGIEGAFCAGNDLADFLAMAKGGGGITDAKPTLRLIEQLTTCPLPVVAAVDGVAVGIGVTMLLHFDFVYASPEASFQLAFINLGLVPEAGSTQLLPRIAGGRKAAELLLTGDVFGAEEAQRLDIVSEVVPRAELMDRAMTTARKLAAKPREALRATKALLRRDAEPLMERVMVEAREFDARLRSAEVREAISAFQEKRAPDFAKLYRR